MGTEMDKMRNGFPFQSARSSKLFEDFNFRLDLNMRMAFMILFSITWFLISNLFYLGLSIHILQMNERVYYQ